MIIDFNCCAFCTRTFSCEQFVEDTSTKCDVSFCGGTLLWLIKDIKPSEKKTEIKNKILEMMNSQKLASELYFEWYQKKSINLQISFDFSIGRDYLTKHGLDDDIREKSFKQIGGKKIEQQVLEYGMVLCDVFCDKTKDRISLDNYHLVAQVALSIANSILKQEYITYEDILDWTEDKFTLDTIKEMVLRYFQVFDFEFYKIEKVRL
jgi:hypothetical protein